MTRDGTVVRQVYVRANSDTKIYGIRDGVYKLFVTSGSDWDSKRFTRDCAFSKFDDPFHIHDHRHHGRHLGDHSPPGGRWYCVVQFCRRGYLPRFLTGSPANGSLVWRLVDQIDRRTGGMPVKSDQIGSFRRGEQQPVEPDRRGQVAHDVRRGPSARR